MAKSTLCQAKRLYLPHLLKCEKCPVTVLKQCCDDAKVPYPQKVKDMLGSRATAAAAGEPPAKRRLGDVEIPHRTPLPQGAGARHASVCAAPTSALHRTARPSKRQPGTTSIANATCKMMARSRPRHVLCDICAALPLRITFHLNNTHPACPITTLRCSRRECATPCRRPSISADERGNMSGWVIWKPGYHSFIDFWEVWPVTF